MKIDALGFVEVIGYVTGIEAADAMLKTADVRLLAVHEVNPGLITVEVEGDLAACRAAVNAGRAAAERIGTVLVTHVIGRPDPDTEYMALSHITGGSSVRITPKNSEPVASAPSVRDEMTHPTAKPAVIATAATSKPPPAKKRGRPSKVAATEPVARQKVPAAKPPQVAKPPKAVKPPKAAKSPKATGKEQVKQLRADKQGKALIQTARQWADSLIGEMNDLAVPPPKNMGKE